MFSLFTAIPLLSLIGYATFLSKKLSTKLIYTLPSVTALIIVCLTFFAMINCLLLATYVFYIGGIVCLLVFLQKEEWKLIEKEIVFFLSLLVFFFFYTKNAYFKMWDDFSHWGVFTKELLYRNGFEIYGLPTSILQSHAHYPRGSAIFHYYIMRIPGYSEGGALFAHFLLYVLFLSPLLQNKKLLHSFFLFFSVFSVAILYSSGVRSIYNDSITGLVFGAVLSIFILEKNRNTAFLLLLPMVASLPLIREVGLILSFFMAVILCIHHIGFSNKKISNGFSYITIFFLTNISLLSSFYWKHYLKKPIFSLEEKPIIWITFFIFFIILKQKISKYYCIS